MVPPISRETLPSSSFFFSSLFLAFLTLPHHLRPSSKAPHACVSSTSAFRLSFLSLFVLFPFYLHFTSTNTLFFFSPFLVVVRCCTYTAVFFSLFFSPLLPFFILRSSLSLSLPLCFMLLFSFFFFFFFHYSDSPVAWLVGFHIIYIYICIYIHIYIIFCLFFHILFFFSDLM